MKIRAGGQTGADRGALEAARDLGVHYGGWVPFNRKAEDGQVPLDFENMRETSVSGYGARTHLNVRYSDATLLITLMRGADMTKGSRLTQEICQLRGKPLLILSASWVLADAHGQAVDVVRWLRRVGPSPELNVAGTRESKCPGIQAATRRLVTRVLELWEEKE